MRKIREHILNLGTTKALKGHENKKKSQKQIVTSNCAIRSHGLVIRSLDLDNSVSRIAFPRI